MYRCRYDDGNVTLPSFTIISFTCFVVQPCCLLSFSFFFILTAIFRGSLDGLPTLCLSVFESLYTFFFLYLASSQSEAHVLLLCSSFAIRSGIISSPSTFRTRRSNLSFTSGSASVLYRCSNSLL